MITGLDTPAAYDAFVRAHRAAVVYFGSAECGVCAALWPKFIAVLPARYPQLSIARVDARAAPALAAAQAVFAVPVVVVCFEGREWVRKAGAFSLTELERDIARPYALLFCEGAP